MLSEALDKPRIIDLNHITEWIKISYIRLDIMKNVHYAFPLYYIITLLTDNNNSFCVICNIFLSLFCFLFTNPL